MDAKQAALAVVILVNGQVLQWAKELVLDQNREIPINNQIYEAMELRDAVHIKEVAPIYG